MERKSYEAEVKRIDAEGKGVAVIATLNVIDKDGDVTVPGAFGIGQTVPIVPAHDWQHVPIGKGTIREEGSKALFDFQLNMKLGFARAWYEHLKFDLATPPAKQQWSYGFSIPTGGAEMGEFAGQRVRRLKRLKVHEVSPVLVGSGVDTRTLAMKEFEDHAELAAAFHEVQHKWAVAEFKRLTERAARADRLATDDDDGRVWWKVSHNVPGWDWLSLRAIELAVLAAKELGVAPPRVFFFARTWRPQERAFSTDVEWVGCAGWSERPGEIGIHEDNWSDRGLAEIVGHEVLHYARPSASEKDAEEFGLAFAARHGAPPSAGSPAGFEQAAAQAQALRQQGLI